MIPPLADDFLERASQVINTPTAKAHQLDFLKDWHRATGVIGELEQKYVEGNDLMNIGAILRGKGGFDLITEIIIDWAYAAYRRVSPTLITRGIQCHL